VAVQKRRIVAGEPQARTRSAPSLAAWVPAWSTESPVEAAAAADYLSERAIPSRSEVGVKRHAAMNTVEFTTLHVPSTEVELAIGLLEGRADLFPAATSYSEPLRYGNGMWAKVSRAGLAAQLGYLVFAGLIALIGVALVVLIVATLVAAAT